MTDPSSRPAGGDIHRLLDEAFRGVDMTAEAQDLKEELRGNLLARVAELETAGTEPADAAQQAIQEVGDVAGLVSEIPPARDDEGFEALSRRHRVRPKPGFVVRSVLWSLVMIVSVLLLAAGVLGSLPVPGPALLGPVGWFALALAFLVGDSLSQETTTNHPMRQGRVGGFFWATFLAASAAGVVVLAALGILPLWAAVPAALGAIGAIFLFAYLAATHTNRQKAWVRRAHAGMPRTRFEEEPETAARFGIYTVVTWIVAFAVFLVLSFTLGWFWSWLALLGGFVVMMITLARMLFGPR